ncbi:MAG TPA: ATP/GTP-binding protein [Thermoplasmata archaeon]
MAAKHVYFVGTAGCGKSTLTHAFQLWLQNQGYDGITVNLDPGAENLLYPPDVDIRDWVRLNEIMEEYGLGPNGAQIAAADMMALNIKEVAQVISGFDTDYVLLDTPGQMELFTFRQSSKVVLSELSGESAVIAYLFDPAIARSPNGYVSSLMLAATVQFRLSQPMLTLLSKSDLLSEKERERIQLWSEDFYALLNSLTEEEVDAQTNVSVEFLQALETIGAGGRIVPVSADTGEGLEDIYTLAQQVLEGGEDIGS